MVTSAVTAHMAYSSVEDAAHLMHYIGPNMLLAKMDIKEAYRLIPIGHRNASSRESSGGDPSTSIANSHSARHLHQPFLVHSVKH